jgi:hypothetical protein
MRTVSGYALAARLALIFRADDNGRAPLDGLIHGPLGLYFAPQLSPARRGDNSAIRNLSA